MTWIELFTSLEIGLIYGIVALGIYLTFRVIDFPDLTCDGSFVSGAAACAVALKAGFNPILALIFSLIAGGVGGLITAFLHKYGRLSTLLSGILTAFMLYSLNLKIMGGIPNITLIQETTIFSWGDPLFLLLLIAGIVWISCSYLLLTDFGLGLRSIGQNPVLATSYGVNISFFTLIALVLSNGLIGFGGGLFCQHQGFVDISQGIGTIVIGLAAVMIGEKLLPFRSMWIAPLLCFAGSLLYRLLIAFALHNEWTGLESSDLNLITGLLIVLIMRLPRFRGMKSSC